MLVSSILVIFLLPAFALAANADKFVAAKALPSESFDLVVPLDVANVEELAAMDIPLEFSVGASLEKVTFSDRVSSFEVQIANIDNENRQVVIGLISMVTGESPDLAVGDGPVAFLHFNLDPGVDKVEINPIELESPNHSLTYYYNDYSSGRPVVTAVHPEVETGQVFYSQGSSSIPTAYALHQNSPNPFNPQTAIMFDMPNAGDVKISVFNVLGQNVTNLVDGRMEAGTHEVIWNGKDRDGATVASGIYFYRIDTDQYSDTKKMMLLK
jgi:hypothetical protein